MRAWLLRRLALAPAVLFVVSTAVFGLVHAVPGDPIDAMIGENATLDRKVELRRAYHLDEPVLLNTRPWLSRRGVERLVARLGPAADPLLLTADQATAQQKLEDLGRWAVAPLAEIWADPTTPPGLRARATTGLVVATAQSGRPLSTEQSRRPGGVEAWAAEHWTWAEPGFGTRLHALIFGTQYARFFSDLLGGRLKSLHSRRPVSELLVRRFAATLRLAGAALLVAILIAVPIGTLAARRQYSWVDNSSMVAALFGISMPNFWLGPLLILAFSIELGWFPVSGADQGVRSLVLPAVTLGLGMSAILTRITRAAVLDVLSQDFVRTARGKGLSEGAVLFRHALRAALLPVVTVLGLQLGALLAGSIITEEIFGWPGMGRELILSIRSRDVPVLQGCVLLIAATYVTVNLATDVLYAVVDPRVRLDA